MSRQKVTRKREPTRLGVQTKDTVQESVENPTQKLHSVTSSNSAQGDDQAKAHSVSPQREDDVNIDSNTSFQLLQSPPKRSISAGSNANDDSLQTPVAEDSNNVLAATITVTTTSSIFTISRPVDKTPTTVTSFFTTGLAGPTTSGSDITHAQSEHHDSHSGLTPGVVAGVVISIIFVLICLAGGLVWLRRRRRSRMIQETRTDGGDSIRDSLFVNVNRQTVIEPFRISLTGSTNMRNNTERGTSLIPLVIRPTSKAGPATPSSYTPGTASNSPLANVADSTPSTDQPNMEPLSDITAPWNRASRNSSRRAIDAGPVSPDTIEEEDDRSTLPPDYSDVFNISRSSTVTSGRRSPSG